MNNLGKEVQRDRHPDPVGRPSIRLACRWHPLSAVPQSQAWRELCDSTPGDIG